MSQYIVIQGNTLFRSTTALTMGKKGKRGDKPAEKKAVVKRLNALAKNLEEELKGADLFAPPTPETEDCPICLVPLSRLPSFSFIVLGKLLHLTHSRHPNCMMYDRNMVEISPLALQLIQNQMSQEHLTKKM